MSSRLRERHKVSEPVVSSRDIDGHRLRPLLLAL